MEIKEILSRLETLETWMKAAIPPKEVITADAAFRLVGVHPKAMQKAIDKGLLHSMTMYGQPRYLRSEVKGIARQLVEIEAELFESGVL